MKKYTYHEDEIAGETFRDVETGEIIVDSDERFNMVKAACVAIQIQDYVHKCSEQQSALVPGKEYTVEV